LFGARAGKNALRALDTHQNDVPLKVLVEKRRIAGSMQMLDAIVLIIGLGFFALSVGYTIACDRL
jgi:hypothetical protein